MKLPNSWMNLIRKVTRYALAGRRCPPRTHSLRLETMEDRSLLNAVPFVPGVGWQPLPTDLHPYDASTILVDFTSVSAASAVLSGTSVVEAIGLVPGLREIHLTSGLSVDSAVAAYQANPLVRFAEPNYLVHTALIPNNPLFNQQWDMQNTGQTGGIPGADIHAPAAWDVTVGSGNTRVADIDTGIDYNHQSLAANLDANRGYNFINNTDDPYDDNGHGTHTAGTIGAVGNNGVGVVGVNWHVRLMALKFLDANGYGSIADAVRALDYAVAQGVTISNNSWGSYSYSQSLYDAINNAGSIGHIFVAAAGNSGLNNDSLPFYPASYNLDNIISVAASDNTDHLAYFSNYGANSVHLAAPGVNVLSTWPGNQYAVLSGTSMATPHVTGVVALVRDQHPDWDYHQVINQVLSTVDPLPALQGVTLTGGRLDAAHAVGNVFPAPRSNVGVFLNGGWWLDYNGDRTWDAGDVYDSFGTASGAVPVVGDWNGDGRTKVGVFLNWGWWLDYNGDGTWDAGDVYYSFGTAPGAVPVVGDWNGDGRTEVGVYLNGGWWLDYNGDGTWDAGDLNFTFGSPGTVPVTGDWSGHGRTDVGVFLNGGWWLDYNGDRTWDGGDLNFTFGSPGTVPVTGDWSGHGRTDVGVFLNGGWWLDYNSDYTWDGGDLNFTFGSPGTVPVVGKWSGATGPAQRPHTAGTLFLSTAQQARGTGSTGVLQGNSVPLGAPSPDAAAIPLPSAAVPVTAHRRTALRPAGDAYFADQSWLDALDPVAVLMPTPAGC